MKKRLHKNGAKNIQFEIAPTNRRSERIALKLGAKLVSDSGGQNYNDPYDPSNIWRT
jgi:RimJ/RimL family protein N-acetyltransferase